MTDFAQELQAALLEGGPERYYTGSLESEGVKHLATVPLVTHWWYVLTLDAYRRETDGALAGVRWMRPASELQDGQDRSPEVVAVEEVMRPTYRVARS